jgi:hypothetical protein
VQLGGQYAAMRKPQELFTHQCVFFSRGDFGPRNSCVSANSLLPLSRGIK